MSRIPTPATIDAAPAPSRPLLEAVKKQLGVVPNMFRLVANSPAALEGYLGLSGALNRGVLPAPTRERIALAVAETPAMIRRWNADPFGFLRPWNEIPALIGSAPPATPPSAGTGVVIFLMG